jgi:hypothetical protein
VDPDQEYCIAFALSCQIPQFRQLPGDIQRGLMDAMIRLGCTDFACMYFLRTQIEAGNLDSVRRLLIHLNKTAP